MKSRIFLCCAAAAVLLYTGCSLIKSDAPTEPNDNSTPTVPASILDNHDNEESPSISDESNTPAVTVQEAPPIPDETTASEAKEPETTDIKVVTAPVPDNSESQKPEPDTSKADESVTPVITAPSSTDTPTKTESEEPDIDPNYMYQTEDDFFFVVNKQLLLPEDYDIELDYVQGDYKMEVTAAKHMRDMIAAAKEDGIDLKILSTYRTVKYQKNLFDRNVKSRMEKYGMSYEDAYYDTSINIAPPGGSEHNAGLAADIITKNDWDTYEAFEDTKEFAWLQEHAWEYGYILRYLKGKEDITGYIYEPWHYRYVGVKYAKTVRDSGLCLEEYFEKYVWADGADPVFPWDKLV